MFLLLDFLSFVFLFVVLLFIIKTFKNKKRKLSEDDEREIEVYPGACLCDEVRGCLLKAGRLQSASGEVTEESKVAQQDIPRTAAEVDLEGRPREESNW